VVDPEVVAPDEDGEPEEELFVSVEVLLLLEEGEGVDSDFAAFLYESER